MPATSASSKGGGKSQQGSRKSVGSVAGANQKKRKQAVPNQGAPSGKKIKIEFDGNKHCELCKKSSEDRAY